MAPALGCPLASVVQPVHTFIFVHDVKFPVRKFCLSIGKWTVGYTARLWTGGQEKCLFTESSIFRKFYLFYLSIVLGSTPNEDSGIWWPCLKRKIRESGPRWAMGKIWDLTFYKFCAHFIYVYIMQSFHLFLSRSLISLGRETWGKNWSLNNYHRYNSGMNDRYDSRINDRYNSRVCNCNGKLTSGSK